MLKLVIWRQSMATHFFWKVWRARAATCAETVLKFEGIHVARIINRHSEGLMFMTMLAEPVRRGVTLI